MYADELSAFMAREKAKEAALQSLFSWDDLKNKADHGLTKAANWDKDVRKRFLKEYLAQGLTDREVNSLKDVLNHQGDAAKLWLKAATDPNFGKLLL